MLQQFVSFPVWVIPARQDAAGFLLIESSGTIPHPAHGAACTGLPPQLSCIKHFLSIKMYPRPVTASVTSATFVPWETTLKRRCPFGFDCAIKLFFHLSWGLIYFFNCLCRIVRAVWMSSLHASGSQTAWHGFCYVLGVCVYRHTHIFLCLILIIIIICPQYLHQ